jgi:hypothetical protein
MAKKTACRLGSNLTSGFAVDSQIAEVEKKKKPRSVPWIL